MFWLKSVISDGCNTAVTLDLDTFVTTLTELTAQQSFCVAYSGGLDSTVLLHLLWRLQQQQPQLQVRAIHIHHGFSAYADTWVQHCTTTCAAWQLPLTVYRLHIPKDTGSSLEELARTARYQQLQQALAAHECLVLAHHADDQAETLLLQLLRGAGLPGLAAMPAVKQVNGCTWVRPLLGYPREELEHYAVQHALQWIEDDSNTNLQFARNYLRHQVMPTLKSRWPAVATTLSRSAQHVAQAHQALQTQAAQDAQGVVGKARELSLSALLQLPLARQHAVVRYWIGLHGLRAPSTQQLTKIFEEVIAARRDASPCVVLGACQVRRFQDALYLRQPTATQPSAQYDWDLQQPLALGEGLGTLQAVFSVGRGLRIPAGQTMLQVRFRQGGEHIKPIGAAYTYSLKKLLQAHAIPVWQRGSIPLIYHENELVMVVGYWISAAHAAAPDQVGCEITFMSQGCYEKSDLQDTLTTQAG